MATRALNHALAVMRGGSDPFTVSSRKVARRRCSPAGGCYFERALVVALEQQVKSWELRAATSVARVWRDQSKTCRGNEDRCNQMNKQGGTESQSARPPCPQRCTLLPSRDRGQI